MASGSIMVKNYTLAMTLDPESAALISRIEADVAAVHGQHRLYGEGVRPHLTFGMFETVDQCRAGGIIDAFVERFPVVPVTFASLGLFVLETDVVFVTPIVTADLLARHAWLHERLAACTEGPFTPLLPGSWVPHATLAADVPLPLLAPILTVARRMPLPLEARLERILLARFPIGPVLHERALRGDAPGER